MPFQRTKPQLIGAKAPFLGFIEPSLATSIGTPPSGDRWIHEIKFDGYRVQLHIANEAVRVFTRNGHDWTKRFKKVADDAFHISASSAIIDGEIVVPAVDGTTDFSVLQNELKGKSTKIVMVAFDLLHLNGRIFGSCRCESANRTSKSSSRRPTFSSAKALKLAALRC